VRRLRRAGAGSSRRRWPARRRAAGRGVRCRSAGRSGHGGLRRIPPERPVRLMRFPRGAARSVEVIYLTQCGVHCTAKALQQWPAVPGHYQVATGEMHPPTQHRHLCRKLRRHMSNTRRDTPQTGSVKRVRWVEGLAVRAGLILNEPALHGIAVSSLAWAAGAIVGYVRTCATP
jgi:hypothetical protein